MRPLKQNQQRLERKWYCCQIDSKHSAWKDCLVDYKKAGTAFYSSVAEENQTNQRVLFSTTAKLAKSRSCVLGQINCS